MTSRIEDLRKPPSEVLRIAAVHGASRVRVFGSGAAGRSNTKSDIDLLVELQPERSLLDHVALIQDLDDLLGRPVDVVTKPALRPEIRDAAAPQ